MLIKSKTFRNKISRHKYSKVNQSKNTLIKHNRKNTKKSKKYQNVKGGFRIFGVNFGSNDLDITNFTDSQENIENIKLKLYDYMEKTLTKYDPPSDNIKNKIRNVVSNLNQLKNLQEQINASGSNMDQPIIYGKVMEYINSTNHLPKTNLYGKLVALFDNSNFIKKIDSISLKKTKNNTRLFDKYEYYNDTKPSQTNKQTETNKQTGNNKQTGIIKSNKIATLKSTYILLILLNNQDKDISRYAEFGLVKLLLNNGSYSNVDKILF